MVTWPTRKEKSEKQRKAQELSATSLFPLSLLVVPFWLCWLLVSPPVAESSLRETPRILLLSHMVLLIRRTLMNKPRIMLPCQEPRPSRLADCVSNPALSFTSSVALDKPLFLPRPLFPHVDSDSWGRVKERMQSGFCTWDRAHA